VIATASGRNHDFVQGVGADEVIDSRARPFEDQVSGVNAGVDTVGGETFPPVQRGRVGGGHRGPNDRRSGRTGTAGINVAWVWIVPSRSQLDQLSALVTSGQLRPHISRTFVLEQVPDDRRVQETGHTVGTLVLTAGGSEGAWLHNSRVA